VPAVPAVPARTVPGTGGPGRCIPDVIRRWLAVAVLASACTAAVPPPGPEELIVSEGLSTLVLDAKTGATVRNLPEGVLSPTKDAIVSLTSSPLICGTRIPSEPCTVAAAHDLQGNRLAVWTLNGTYALPATYGPAASGFSPNGKWLVLVKRDVVLSTFAVLDLSSLGGPSSPDVPRTRESVEIRTPKEVVLSSRFSFDAIHNDGGALYLIEHPVAGSTAYNVRLYEVNGKRLVPEPIFDQKQLVALDPMKGLMDGAFHASVAPVGGQWSYGLYVGRNGRPFVHALNVAARYATCIVDLPGTRTGSSMLALALTPDAKRLFVSDTGTGTVSEIDAETQKVRRSGSFVGRGGTGDGSRALAVVSPDRSRLYATASRGIAVLDTADLSLRSWAAPELAVTALALSADGSRLYALAAGSLHVIETSSGRPLGAFALPSSARAISTVTVR